jgi:glycosyltransferase involved in cell wall biosynthesis
LRIFSVLIRSTDDEKAWGSELSYLELANELVKQGVELDTLEVFPSISHTRFSRSRHYITSSTGWGPIRFVRQTLDAVRIARANSSDVVFVPADYYLGSLVIANVTSLLTGRPLFLGILDPFNSEADQTSQSTLLLQTIRGTRSLRSCLFPIVRKASARRAVACLVLTARMSEYCHAILGAKKTIIIERGVERSWFVSGDEPKSIDAIFVGRLCKDKGVDTLLRAWEEVLRTRPDARLVIVGSGDKQGALEKMVSDLDIGKSVTFVGYLNEPSRIQELLHSSKLFLLPSKNEGFARAVSEAMACGLPCIISDLPNLRELYGGVAVFVPVGDHMMLAEEIIDLLADEPRCAKIGQSSRARAKEFQWDKAARITSAAFAASVAK